MQESIGMMRRRYLLLAITAAACARRTVSKEQLLPPHLAAFTRSGEVQELSSGQTGVHRRLLGNYQGPGSVRVEILDLGSSAGGLDMAQKWKPAADTVVFYKDHYFVIVKWDDADREAVTALVRELERRLDELQ